MANLEAMTLQGKLEAVLLLAGEVTLAVVGKAEARAFRVAAMFPVEEEAVQGETLEAALTGWLARRRDQVERDIALCGRRADEATARAVQLRAALEQIPA